MPRIFVYGTLKRGGTNHTYLQSQTYVTEARTVPGFTLYQPADYPGMVPTITDTAGVSGEVWAVTPECLRQIDRLEGVDEGLYARKPIRLASPHEAMAVETYFYLRPTDRCQHLGSTWPV